MTPEMKRCTKCGEEKPSTSLHWGKGSNPRYLRRTCKDCDRAGKQEQYQRWYKKNGKEYRERNNERIRENHANWRSANSDKIKTWGDRWYLKNREHKLSRQREYTRFYTQENYEEVRRKQRESRQTDSYRAKQRNRRQMNPDLFRAYSAKRRARVRNAEGSYSADDVNKILREQKELCFWCTRSLADGYHIDHFIPLARGGTNYPSNLVCACASCNHRKGSKMPWEFAPDRFSPPS